MDQQQTRPETGIMRFGDDWSGIFIRGDNAFYYAMNLGLAYQELKQTKLGEGPVSWTLQELARLFSSCNHAAPLDKENPTQMLRDFKECLPPNKLKIELGKVFTCTDGKLGI